MEEAAEPRGEGFLSCRKAIEAHSEVTCTRGCLHHRPTFKNKQQPAHEKIGVVDAQWIRHLGKPTLGEQVHERCHLEWDLFKDRMATAEKRDAFPTGIW
ncbi:hypothetical protein R1sor_023785 [Riccia sorocarpa]|uniref:Uncharacterized protein n=1 Tax=Riccia sorocarpa TaxID=122646 RepID=A0ABD3GSQ2_9MARC